MTKYSVVSINIDGYECVHEIQEKSNNAEYILLTNDHNIKSDTWTIKYIDKDEKRSSFYTVFYLRYHIFDYINTDIAFVVDGSIQINKNLDIFVQKMEKNDNDCCLFLHNFNITMCDEYTNWELTRNYPNKHIADIIELMSENFYYNNKGNMARTILIQKNTAVQNKLNKLVFDYCRLLKYDNFDIDRLDQTIFSYIMQMYFSDNTNPLYCSCNLLNDSEYFTWYGHNSMEKMYTMCLRNEFEYYFFNKKVEIFKP